MPDATPGPSAEQMAEWKGQAGWLLSANDRMLTDSYVTEQARRVLALLAEVERLTTALGEAEAERDAARAHARTGWDVHAEHVDTAGDAVFATQRAERAEAALADLRARVEALAEGLGPWEEANADEIRALLAEDGAQ